jgi:hypothetical protein
LERTSINRIVTSRFGPIGVDHYPISWPILDYDEKLGGYRVDITDEQLKNAPKN